MASFLETYDLRYDEMLRKRVAGAVTKKADAILIEAGSTPNHAARLVWAEAALRDPVAETEKIMWRVVQNGTIRDKQAGASIAAGNVATDADIEFVVNVVVDALLTPPA